MDMTIAEIKQWMHDTLPERRIVYQEMRVAYDSIKDMPRETVDDCFARMVAFTKASNEAMDRAKRRIKLEVR